MDFLNQADADFFYSTLRILMDYSNRKFHIDSKIDFLHDKGMNPDSSKKAVDQIWDNPALIDDILRTTELSEEQRSLLSSWKNCVKGTFFIERHLKDGSIFIGAENEVYQVLGIRSSIKEMLGDFPMPIIAKTALLPFKEVIIVDGLLNCMPMMLGPGIRSTLKDTYMNAKQNGQIIRQLPEQNPKPAPKSVEKPAAKKAAPSGKSEKPANLYRLKVYPNGGGRSVYRIIEICGNATLDKLCSVIMDAFDFIHEHCYEFIMDGYNAFQSDPEYGERSARVKLDKLGLIPKQKFTLHYDFGDDWMFTIKVESISQATQIKPRVVKSMGSVEQYPDYEDSDEWE